MGRMKPIRQGGGRVRHARTGPGECPIANVRTAKTVFCVPFGQQRSM